MKCFYHKSDFDGICSGAIVLSMYPRCEMIGVDYNNSLFFENLTPNEQIYIVDFSFSMDDMVKLNKICKVHWIDHHRTSIDAAFKSDFLASGGQSLEVGQAGCELVWRYVYPLKPMPLSVRLLGRYDVWDHSDEKTLPFQYGMRQIENMSPQHGVWLKLFKKDKINQIISDGKLILRYQNKENAIYAKGMFYEADFEGYRAIIMNKAYANSKAFDAVYDPEKHDIMIIFGVKPGELKYSIYCDKPDIDVSEIAKKYGGGGHKGAAGFYSKTQVI